MSVKLKEIVNLLPTEEEALNIHPVKIVRDIGNRAVTVDVEKLAILLNKEGCFSAADRAYKKDIELAQAIRDNLKSILVWEGEK